MYSSKVLRYYFIVQCSNKKVYKEVFVEILTERKDSNGCLKRNTTSTPQQLLQLQQLDAATAAGPPQLRPAVPFVYVVRGREREAGS